jgi:hypothetical protein
MSASGLEDTFPRSTDVMSLHKRPPDLREHVQLATVGNGNPHSIITPAAVSPTMSASAALR